MFARREDYDHFGQPSSSSRGAGSAAAVVHRRRHARAAARPGPRRPRAPSPFRRFQCILVANFLHVAGAVEVAAVDGHGGFNKLSL